MASPLTSSLEDYLEAAYALCGRDGSARACELSRRLKVSRPSVSSAVKALAARGLLTYERYGLIRLTPAGRRAGAEVAGRHGALLEFFTDILGLPPAEAERDACRAEHAVGRGTLRAIARLTARLKAAGRAPLRGRRP